MTEQNDRMEEIFEVVTFIKDNAVSKQEFDELKGDVEKIKNTMATRQEFDELKKEVMKIQSTMVDKDYLDDKLADLRGDLVVLTRKEDTKLKTLVGILRQKQMLTESEEKTIYALEPFAQL